MATKLNIHFVKTHLSRLLNRVEAGEVIVITKGGQPVGKLVPFNHIGTRTLGSAKGHFVVPRDFNRPLPTTVQRTFWK